MSDLEARVDAVAESMTDVVRRLDALTAGLRSVRNEIRLERAALDAVEASGS